MSRDLFAANTSVFTQSTFIDEWIYLGSNENPHGPSKAAREAMSKALLSTNRYQWKESAKLISALAQPHRLTDKNILLGAGSSELLGLTTLFASFKKGNIIAPDPTFRLWTTAAQHMGLQIKWIPLTEEKDTDLTAMHSAIDSDTSMVYLCNPNNPTGIP
ncbi:aminotransferase class I/II-fold pyridoxal phosphate-dependent enzyme, partial [Brucella sp. 21LCYQ03]|nr:aminotransferase class I/II-fold pyridoxal phosphate-dependent enzyme [Brucella sp. 21LCYQ03]